MSHVEQEHFFFNALDGRPVKVFVPHSVWEDGDAFQRDFGGSYETFLVNELASNGEEIAEFDLQGLQAELRAELERLRPQWQEVQDLVGLAAEHGVGQPARLLRLNVPPDRDWLVPGLIARGGVTLIGGREKLSGKSTLLFYLLGKLERDEATVFGHEYGTPVKTLIVTEEPQYAIRDKCERYDLRDTWIIEDWVWPLDQFPGDSPQKRWEAKLEQVEKLARALEADHLVIDPFSRVAQIEDESGREMGARAEAVSSLAYRSGLAVTLIHHNNKANDKEIEDRFRGTTSLTAAVEQIVQVERQTKSKHERYPRQRHLWSLGRVQETDWEKLIEVSEDLQEYEEVDLEGQRAEREAIAAVEREAARSEGMAEDLGVVKELGGDCNVREFVEGIGLGYESRTRQDGRKRLEALVKAGLLEKDATGAERRYYLPHGADD